MKKLVSLVLFLGMIVGVLLYATGMFHGEQVEPGVVPGKAQIQPPTETVKAERVPARIAEDAVGTVTSRKIVVVSAQISARVLKVETEAGASVKKGDLLLVLDDREFKARRGQASDGLRQTEAAQAAAVHAKAKSEAALEYATNNHRRIKKLVESNTVSTEELDRAVTALLQAKAGVAEAEAAIAAAAANIARAKQALEETDVALGHTKIHSPIAGVISMKAVEPGDIAWPGKSLLEILDPYDLRLEAQVREGLITGIERSGEYTIRIPAVNVELVGTVSEICPAADPLSRTFRVRVEFEPTVGIRPGMFGRLHIPQGEREVVAVPESVIERIGQLEAVLVKDDETWARRFVTTGRTLLDGRVEVLSGLDGSETLGLQGAK